MEEKLHYTTIEEQINKLRSQNLIITNEELVKSSLNFFGYSSLIRSYREPYTIRNGQKILYRSGVTFEQIYSLYILDKNLRNAVMAAMQDLEEHIKAVAADVIAKSFGIHQDNYLQYRNYQNKRKRKYRFTLAGILDTMKNSLETDKEPIHHYMEKYETVPPWILFKSIYFSTIVNYIDLFKQSEQQKMVEHLYDGEKLGLSSEVLCKLMMDTLFICIDYRNTAAHGGRIYNFNSSKRLRVDEIFDTNISKDINGFSILLFLLRLFRYQSPSMRLDSILEQELNRHCNEFPKDITYLGQILNINIFRKEIVWISDKSKKYHSVKYCNGMHNSKEIALDNALSQGYIPCKKCCK